MLRGYYDGSGTTADSPCLTLTGLVASESVWERFEDAWAAVLMKHDISYFHMTDAMALRGQFSSGWTDEKVHALILKLLQVLGRFRAISGSSESNLIARSCTIVVDDYRRASHTFPSKRLKPFAWIIVWGEGSPKILTLLMNEPPQELF